MSLQLYYFIQSAAKNYETQPLKVGRSEKVFFEHGDVLDAIFGEK